MILGTLLLSFLLADPAQTARAQFDDGNYKAALNTLNAGLEKSANSASLHYWAARTNYEMRNYDEAVKHAELAVQFAPEDAEYNRWLWRKSRRESQLFSRA
jgi:tetratricopeptide (TPR) repeat protein